MEIPELGHSAARSRQAIPDEDDMSPLPPCPDVIHADAAFIVYRQTDGQVVLSADLNAPISVAPRGLLNHDIIGMVNCVLEDIRLMSTAPAVAAQVVAAVKGEQQQQMKQMEDAQILARLQQASVPNSQRGNDRVKFQGRHG